MSVSVFTLADFLSADHCQALVQDAEQRGFEPAPITTGFGFVMAPEVRSNTRVIVDDVALATRLWARFCELTTPEPIRGWRPIGLNERFRFYRYTSGQAFRWHRDGSFIRHGSEQSLLTFMVYLNDGFGGGATDFEERSITPRAGQALIFDHGLRHQGAAVTRGVKYVLRSDIMFEHPE